MDDRRAAEDLCQPFLKLFPVIIRCDFFNLSTDLLHAGFDFRDRFRTETDAFS